MAIKVEDLRKVLPGVLVEPPGLKWHGGDSTFFHYPAIETDWGEIRLLLNLLDEGRFLQFRSIDLFTLSDNQRLREKQVEIILTHNYRKKTVQFAYDPEDDEVCLYVDLPLLDNTELTRSLMERIFASIRVSGGDILRELKLTVKSGPPSADQKPHVPEKKLLSALLRRFFRIFYGQCTEA